MLLDIALQYTFSFVDPLNSKTLKNCLDLNLLLHIFRRHKENTCHTGPRSKSERCLFPGGGCHSPYVCSHGWTARHCPAAGWEGLWHGQTGQDQWMDSSNAGHVSWVCTVAVSTEACSASGWSRRLGKISIMSIRNFVGGHERKLC